MANIMRTKIIIGSVLLTLLLAVLWIVYQPTGQSEPVGDQAAVTQTVSQSKIAPSTPTSNTKAKQALEAQILEQRALKIARKKEFEERYPDDAALQAFIDQTVVENPQARKLYNLYQAATQEIEFHGQITDADNNPIPGVNAYFSIGVAYGIGQPGSNIVQSDSDGRYVIKGYEGASVRLYKFIKPGYRFPSINQSFYTATEAGRPLSWKDYVAAAPYKTIGEETF
mgnify:CR=1 FL=1